MARRLSVQKIPHLLSRNAEVKVVRITEFGKIHGHQISPFVHYRAAAGALQRGML